MKQWLDLRQAAKKLKSRFNRGLAVKILLGALGIAIIGSLLGQVVQNVQVEKRLNEQLYLQSQTIEELQKIATLYEELKNEDQVAINASLSAEILNIEKTYQAGAGLFEQRAEMLASGNQVVKVDLELAKFLRFLADKQWEEAEDQTNKVQEEIERIVQASIPKLTSPIAESNNTLAESGYTRQKVNTSRGEFVVSLVSAPGATVTIETAGESDCTDNCPTKSLAEHVAAAGGFAGINGAYFCPPDYARCQGKVNTFDTLAVNGRTKAVLNRDNNVYSTIPLVAAYGNQLSFYDQTVQWGVDTSSGGALANYPRLLRNGEIATTEENGKGTRGFIAQKDNIIVIGHVFAASYGDEAEVLKTLGLVNAMNLDGGGSSTLWFGGGYKVGPGRSLPTAIVLK